MDFPSMPSSISKHIMELILRPATLTQDKRATVIIQNKASLIRYVNVTSGDEIALKNAVATIGPISAMIDASHNSFLAYETGIYVEPACSTSNVHHGVLIVGYGTDNGQDYWIEKNSFGTYWGIRGFILMARYRGNNCGIATAASYPLVQ